MHTEWLAGAFYSITVMNISFCFEISGKEFSEKMGDGLLVL